MVYVKSLIAGLMAVILAAMLCLVTIALYVASKTEGNQIASWDPISLVRAAQFRRASAR